jgi:hypothetical protein
MLSHRNKMASMRCGPVPDLPFTNTNAFSLFVPLESQNHLKDQVPVLTYPQWNNSCYTELFGEQWQEMSVHVWGMYLFKHNVASSMARRPSALPPHPWYSSPSHLSLSYWSHRSVRSHSVQHSRQSLPPGEVAFNEPHQPFLPLTINHLTNVQPSWVGWWRRATCFKNSSHWCLVCHSHKACWGSGCLNSHFWNATSHNILIQSHSQFS